MASRIVWAPLARHHLLGIVDYIARDSPEAAAQVHRTILRGVARLGEWPLIGPWVGSRYADLSGLDETHRVLVVRPYAVFYRALDLEVRVLTIHHGAQLPPAAEDLAGREGE
jgi:plasmid stabilization system protein ParE